MSFPCQQQLEISIIRLLSAAIALCYFPSMRDREMSSVVGVRYLSQICSWQVGIFLINSSEVLDSRFLKDCFYSESLFHLLVPETATFVRLVVQAKPAQQSSPEASFSNDKGC